MKRFTNFVIRNAGRFVTLDPEHEGSLGIVLNAALAALDGRTPPSSERELPFRQF
jgi:hypothetical protein